MKKKHVELEKNRLREEAIDALERATNARLVIRRGPKTVRYTITYSLPRGQEPKQ